MREQKKKKDRAALALVLCFCVVALTSVFAVKSSLNKINAERTNMETAQTTENPKADTGASVQKLNTTV